MPCVCPVCVSCVCGVCVGAVCVCAVCVVCVCVWGVCRVGVVRVVCVCSVCMVRVRLVIRPCGCRLCEYSTPGCLGGESGGGRRGLTLRGAGWGGCGNIIGLSFVSAACCVPSEGERLLGEHELPVWSAHLL